MLTYNEERNLAACLGSVADWAGEIFVIDSGSTDSTREIAERYGANVLVNPFETHAKQWNWGFRHLPFCFDWALCLDADQRVTAELAAEVRALAGGSRSPGVAQGRRQESLDHIDGLYVKRRQIFRGKWIRYGSYYPIYLLKLVRHEKAWCDENELLDFRIYVKGATARLRHDLIEDNKNEEEISFWIEKHNRFALLQAKEEIARRRNVIKWAVRPSLFGTPDQRTLWLKERWYRMPLYVRPFIYFLYRYIVRLGFLDGKDGFVFHFLQAFWYRLLVDINVDQLQQRP